MCKITCVGNLNISWRQRQTSFFQLASIHKKHCLWRKIVEKRKRSILFLIFLGCVWCRREVVKREIGNREFKKRERGDK